jgi:hypothetical protein
MTIFYHVWLSGSRPSFRDQGTVQFIVVVPALKLDVAGVRVRLAVGNPAFMRFFILIRHCFL